MYRFSQHELITTGCIIVWEPRREKPDVVFNLGFRTAYRDQVRVLSQA